MLARLYNTFLRRFLRRSFFVWQRLGFHITPKQYYQPIPDTAELPEHLWTATPAPVGLTMNAEAQLTLLDRLQGAYQKEYDLLPVSPTGTPWQFYLSNGAFEAVDAEVLYAMIRSLQPKRIIEIGSGYSTFLAAQALRVNEEKDHSPGELLAIEPYPNLVLQQGFPGLTRLSATRVQDVPLELFRSLRENDILFIDSSHVLCIGSDVQHEILQVLPRVPVGVYVHFHDIFLPAEYPRDWVLRELRFWNEQYLLQAFLTFNDTFSVVWAGNYMALKYPLRLKTAFKSFSPKVRPGSFWMKRVQ